MKVFQLVDNPYVGNPYVSTLLQGVKHIDSTIEFGYGLRNFWSDDVLKYDIIHIHWPHDVVQFFSNKNIISDFKQRIIMLKKNGIKIIATCHNFEPHYEKDIRKIHAYTITYELADCILHLGEYSLNYLKDKYPSAQHILLPHHTYDMLYTVESREKSLKYLSIIKSEIDRSLNIMSDFMDYSKIKINKEIFDLSMLLQLFA